MRAQRGRGGASAPRPASSLQPLTCAQVQLRAARSPHLLLLGPSAPDPLPGWGTPHADGDTWHLVQRLPAPNPAACSHPSPFLPSSPLGSDVGPSALPPPVSLARRVRGQGTGGGRAQTGTALIARTGEGQSRCKRDPDVYALGLPNSTV